MAKLTINNKIVEAPDGMLLTEAAKMAGIEIPTLCYHPELQPYGGCRLCLVRIEKMPKLQTACTTRVCDNMIVTTDSPEIEKARKGMLEFVLTYHPLDCPICDKGGECELQNLVFKFGSGFRRYAEDIEEYTIDTNDPLIDRELDRCVRCLRCVRVCDEVQGVTNLTAYNRGSHTEIGPFMGGSIFNCEYCGSCVSICPVGALTSKLFKYKARPWQTKRTETICTYCGCGCQFALETRNGEVLRVVTDYEKGVNEGSLCARGRFGYSFVNNKKRLATPLIKTNTKLEPTSWDEATDIIADKFKKIIEDNGPDAVAGIITGHCTNEDIYLFQKFMRLAIGTNNIDSAARYGYVNAMSAIKHVIGSKRFEASLEDVANADVILSICSNITEVNPIAGLKVRRAAKRGAELIVADVRDTDITKFAAQNLIIKSGSERWFIHGLIKAVVEEELYDKKVYKEHKKFIDNLNSALKGLSFEEIEEKTGISEKDIVQAAKAYSKAKKGVIILGQGITHQQDGYKSSLNILDLCIITGNIDSKGTAILPLCDENNEYGALEMGAAPEFLPGFLNAGDAKHRDIISKIWDKKTPSKKGMTISEIFNGVLKGKIKALYVIGENPAGTFPQKSEFYEALQKLDFLVCQDLFPTATCELSDIVLPAASFAEKDGTFTNMEGRAQKIKAAITPIGESRPDWQIFSALSEKMGYPMDYDDADAILKEIAQVVEGCRAEEEKDAIGDYVKISLKDLKSMYERKEEKALTKFPFKLMLGPVLFHSGKLSGYSEGPVRILPEGRLKINPNDADRLGIIEGDRALLKNVNGEVKVKVEITDRMPEGLLFYPEHFMYPAVRNLCEIDIDKDTKANYFKTTFVAVERHVPEH